MHAVILAAGKGTRLLPLTKNTPKPLIDVRGKPLLFHALEALPEAVDSITIVIGYLGDQIKKRVGDEWEGKPVRYVLQRHLTGTGDAVALLKKDIRTPTLVMNADDVYEPNDLRRLTRHPLAILALKTRAPLAYPVRVTPFGRCRGFLPPSEGGRAMWQNCGAYMIDDRYFSIPTVRVRVRDGEEGSLPHTLLALAGTHAVKRVRATHWQPVGTHEELLRVHT